MLLSLCAVSGSKIAETQNFSTSTVHKATGIGTGFILEQQVLHIRARGVGSGFVLRQQVLALGSY